jgi:hypothetical protein
MTDQKAVAKPTIAYLFNYIHPFEDIFRKGFAQTKEEVAANLILADKVVKKFEDDALIPSSMKIKMREVYSELLKSLDPTKCCNLITVMF